MASPLILVVGQAGSGKDTVASFLVKNHGGATIAQADPMKRLGSLAFGFSDDQLWGPSESRNAPDNRFLDPAEWLRVELALDNAPEVQRWLVDVLPATSNPGVYQNAHLALKNWFRTLKSMTAGKALTPRLMLQTLGTEWGRYQSRDMWSDYAIKTAFTLLGGGYTYHPRVGLIETPTRGPDFVVITDGRFRNEVVNVLRVGGLTVRIDSPNIDTSAVEKAGVAGHASEKEQKDLPDHFFTGVFLNDKRKGLRACEQFVRAFVKDLLGRPVQGGRFP